MQRVFSTEGINPFDQVKWEHRTAEIKDDKGNVVFEQDGVEVPKFYSKLATDIVASKYFYGAKGTEERESSVRQLVYRVAGTIAAWGYKDGYFDNIADMKVFEAELTYLCLNQYGAFNSPVWFNVGLSTCYQVKGPANNWRWEPGDPEKGWSAAAVPCEDAYKYPQGSACFIQSVGDDMRDIMALATSEAMLFKYGSGTGTDLSTLRSSRELLAGGGKPSGPVSFMRVYDSIAGVVKSGGKTRRAAKMQTLKVHHPDILEFIEAKPKEDAKAQALIKQGYSSDYNGGAYESVCFQNANLSVRATDEFMRRATTKEGLWTTREVVSGKPSVEYTANELMDKIAEGTWLCGDPGMQFEDTIQKWHTCKTSGPINSSNPCSEYMFIDDSACNLASINLMKFRREDGTFEGERFKAAVRIFLLAQEILVDNVSYPTEKICENSHKFRTLGLGYANLGCLLMSMGLPYDSEAGRDMAAAITALMHGAANVESARVAERMGAFSEFDLNRAAMLQVMELHRQYGERGAKAFRTAASKEVWALATSELNDAIQLGSQYGYRNAQTTLLAPTGTIAFLMDCDTTGVEPDIALVKYKKLAGGGILKIVNKTVPFALKALGYGEEEVQAIVDYIDAHDTIEGSPLDRDHLTIFDCAFPPANGGRSIHWQGHVRMLAAVTPFLSGAISKTINLPNDATPSDIRRAYYLCWELGIKAAAIYRDGSKGSQPLNTKKDEEEMVRQAGRERLPDERPAIVHKFDIQGHEGYLTVGLYPDGRMGEMFVTMAKEGSTIGGLMDGIGTAISIGLQHGVPLETYVKKFAHTRFEPAGFTKNPDIPIAKSITDYLFRWLGMKFLPGYREENAPRREEAPPATAIPVKVPYHSPDAPACSECGAITIRNGTCFRCHNCGSSMGCS